MAEKGVRARSCDLTLDIGAKDNLFAFFVSFIRENDKGICIIGTVCRFYMLIVALLMPSIVSVCFEGKIANSIFYNLQFWTNYLWTMPIMLVMFYQIRRFSHTCYNDMVGNNLIKTSPKDFIEHIVLQNKFLKNIIAPTFFVFFICSSVMVTKTYLASEDVNGWRFITEVIQQKFLVVYWIITIIALLVKYYVIRNCYTPDQKLVSLLITVFIGMLFMVNSIVLLCNRYLFFLKTPLYPVGWCFSLSSILNVPIATLSLYLTLQMFWRGICSATLFINTINSRELNIIPHHHDECGGFGFVGEYVKKLFVLSLLLVPSVLVFVYSTDFMKEGRQDIVTYCSLFGYVLFPTVCGYILVYMTHSRMVMTKRDLLKKLNTKYTVGSSGCNYMACAEDQTDLKYQSWRVEYDLVKAFPEWPIDWKRFHVYTFVSALSPFISLYSFISRLKS